MFSAVNMMARDTAINEIRPRAAKVGHCVDIYKRIRLRVPGHDGGTDQTDKWKKAYARGLKGRMRRVGGGQW